ncbi:hypothetical protein [Pseudomonas phage PPpW-3]|uniref:Resolvase HTH domain-containing protein n=1 Tax=Pseudomonas phage PPpW-3 TaxID=1279082 RepID=V5YTE2_9CAUD|nr:hypothetical protein X916_gp47 [Pseudomonas phage PPpW-3]BAO20647.1 hypothetical protein [Pseudomonas phage PPpW-3]
MTHPIATKAITDLYDAGESMAAIARALGVSSEVVRYRLKSAGMKPRARRANVTKEAVRRLREHMPALVAMKQFMEASRRDLISRMGDTPGPKTLDRLGTINDFIHTLEEVTA